MKAIDVVYFTVMRSLNNHLDFRSSLRSMDMCLKGVRNVYVIGYLPDWCKNIHHISEKPKYRKNKDANIIEKMIYCCKELNLSYPFLFMNDDHFLTEEFQAIEYPFYHKGELKPVSPNQIYCQRIRTTKSMLLEKGRPVFNYDIHTPILIYKDKFLEAFEGIDYVTTFMVMKSWYVNNWEGFDKGVQISDCKFSANERRDLQTLKPMVMQRPCFTADDIISKQVQNLLYCLYSDKCKYEKNKG